MNTNKEIIQKEEKWLLNNASDISKEIVSNAVYEIKNIAKEDINPEEIIFLSKELVFACIYLIEDTSKLFTPCQRSAVINQFKRALGLSFFEFFFHKTEEDSKEFEYFFSIFEDEYHHFKRELGANSLENLSSKELIYYLANGLLELDFFSDISPDKREKFKEQLVEFLKKKGLSKISIALFS